MDHRQTTAVVAVGISAQLVLHVVTFKVALFSHLDESVFRHGGIPHQIGPSRVILRAVHGNTQISDHTTHQCLHDVIGNIVLIGLAEIGLHDVAEDVKATRCHLFFGYRKGIGGVHQSKSGIESRIIPPCFYLSLFIGDYCAAVALAASTSHSNYYTQRQRIKVDDAGVSPEILPDVPVIPGSQRDSFAAVHGAASAYGQNHIRLIVPCQPRTLLHFVVGGVGHNAGELHDGLSSAFQNACDFIVDTIALDAAAAIGQQDGLRIFCQTGQIFLHTALAEIDLRAVLKNKVVHIHTSFLKIS